MRSALKKATIYLRLFGLTKVPLLFLCRPTVLRLDNSEDEVRIRLGYLTRNHVGSMYFGALSIGADCAGGLLAMYHIRKSERKVSFLFKDFQANFLRRAEGDTVFSCHDGEKIVKALQETLQTGQRVACPLEITARVPSKSESEIVAKFILTLSLKASS